MDEYDRITNDMREKSIELSRLARRDVKMAYICAGASMILAVVSLVLGGVSILG